jgi:hypothetical protein
MNVEIGTEATQFFSGYTKMEFSLQSVLVSSVKTNSVEDPESILLNGSGSEKVKVSPKNEERKNVFSCLKS